MTLLAKDIHLCRHLRGEIHSGAYDKGVEAWSEMEKEKRKKVEEEQMKKIEALEVKYQEWKKKHDAEVAERRCWRIRMARQEERDREADQREQDRRIVELMVELDEEECAGRGALSTSHSHLVCHRPMEF